MKNKIFLLLTLIILFSFVITGSALTRPYDLFHFNSAEELIEWINTVDINNIDSYNQGSYSHKSFIEDIRKDCELIIPKYNGQYFPINVKEGLYGVEVWPEFESKNWRCISFRMDIESTRVSIYIHRIDDGRISDAKQNYENYIANRYSYLGVGGGGGSLVEQRYNRVDRYDVLVTAVGFEDESVFENISFDKVKLSNYSEVVETYSFGKYLVYSASVTTPAENTPEKSSMIYFIIISIFAGIVVVIIIVMAAKKTKKRKS